MNVERYRKCTRLVAGLIMAIGIYLVVPSAQALDLLVASLGTNQVLRYDGQTGAFIDAFVPAGSGGLRGPRGLVFGPDGNLYVSSVSTNSVLRYDGKTGAFIDVFVPPGSGGLTLPTVLVFGPDGNLYVWPQDPDTVLRYDGKTGAFIDVFVPPGNSGLPPTGAIFGQDGNLYVSSHLSNSPTSQNSVRRYDGTTGAFIDVFASTGLSIPLGVVFGPDGNLYVGVRGCCAGTFPSHSTLLRYDGTTGAFIDAFVPPDSGGLLNPNGLVFGPDGNLYVVDSNPDNGQVLRYDGTTGAFIDAFVPPGSGGLFLPIDLAFTPPARFLPLNIVGSPNALSADGTVIVGQFTAAGDVHAFRWTEAGGQVDLATGFGHSGATSVSADGSVVVGFGSGTPWRWTAQTGIVPLGLMPPGFFSGQANDVSADGSVVVGTINGPAVPGALFFEPFRWTAATGIVPLGTLGGPQTVGTAVSADGAVVVGFTNFGTFPFHIEAFRWSAQTGMVGLGAVPGFSNSNGIDVSADGSVVVGTSAVNVEAAPAFRWTEQGGMVSLDDLPVVRFSNARAVSPDGSVVVGVSRDHVFPFQESVFIWDLVHGMRALRDVLLEQGADVSGWRLSSPFGMSADGRVIGGVGTNPSGAPQAWLARLAETPPQVLNAELSGTPDPATFAFDPTPVQDGPAGTFSFTAAFCNIGTKPLTLLKSVTTALTGGNVLLNRDVGTPPGVGSAHSFPATQGFADGVLSAGECLDVPYQIGLATNAPFEFLVDGVGVAR